ncbi:MAG: hypothetical protein OES35_12090, partial [Chromatiales bacterium]|nr:hypothetical protein [Chromatiales bacterium]
MMDNLARAGLSGPVSVRLFVELVLQVLLTDSLDGLLIRQCELIHALAEFRQLLLQFVDLGDLAAEQRMLF